MFNSGIVSSAYARNALDPETIIWRDRVFALGGTLTGSEITIADNLIKAIKAESFNSKVKYLLPFIGDSIEAARVPLRDSFNVGAATLVGSVPFTNSNVGTSIGLANPTEQDGMLDTGLTPFGLNPLNAGEDANGGLGFWERDIGFGTGVEPIGFQTTTTRFCVDLRTNLQGFRWGFPALLAGPATTATNGNYYGQRSSGVLRRIYRDGVSLGNDSTTNGPSTNADVGTIYVMGMNLFPSTRFTWKGRCAVAYLTDGTLSDAEVLALHNVLSNELVIPTGR